MRSTDRPPSAQHHSASGSVTARNTSAVPQDASSLPSAISPARSRVTCRVASVPRSRSPFTDWAASAGATSSASASTTSTTTPNITAPRVSTSSKPRLRWLAALRTSAVMPSSTRNQAATIHRHRPARIRSVNSSRATVSTPLTSAPRRAQQTRCDDPLPAGTPGRRPAGTRRRPPAGARCPPRVGAPWPRLHAEPANGPAFSLPARAASPRARSKPLPLDEVQVRRLERAAERCEGGDTHSGGDQLGQQPRSGWLAAEHLDIQPGVTGPDPADPGTLQRFPEGAGIQSADAIRPQGPGGGKVAGCVLPDRAAAVDEDDPVRDLLQIGQDVARDEDR